MVIAEKEYDTRRTLPAFAEAHLGDRYEIDTVSAPDEEGRNNLAGLEKAEDYDLILLSVRRRAPTTPQLSALRRYVDGGGPLVVIRTSCHAFSLRGDEPPAGHAVWNHFDTEVLVASIRGPSHVIEAAQVGAHVSTLPPNVLRQLFQHPLTDKGLAAFMKDWEATGQSILEQAAQRKDAAE